MSEVHYNQPGENLEIKFRLPRPRQAKKMLQQAPEYHYCYLHHQQDIYFRYPDGRLKLRVEEECEPCLICYHRENQAEVRPSQYTLTPVASARQTLQKLASQYGVLGTVEKWRELYTFRNVRIHLDQVTSLGWFLELESVVSRQTPRPQARHNLQQVIEKLEPFLGDPVGESYLELLQTEKRNG